MHELPLDRVLIVMMSAVGDAVHVLPVVNAIKRYRPGTHITWVLQPGPARLVRGHPAVDEIILFERSRGLQAFTDIRHELSRRTFDVALALQVYFNQQPWYRPVYPPDAFPEGLLSPVERYNAELIASYQATH